MTEEMLFMHIGRPKVGSTTLQHTLRANREVLKDAGFVWPELVERTSWNFVQLAQALRSVPGNDEGIPALRGIVRNLAQSCAIISSEFLFSLPQNGIRQLRSIVGDRVTILLYIRDYADWLVSRYTQKIMKGRNTPDFDLFYSESAELVSIREQLGRWLRAFAGEQIFARHTSLLETSLIGDVSIALGVSSQGNRTPQCRSTLGGS